MRRSSSTAAAVPSRCRRDLVELHRLSAIMLTAFVVLAAAHEPSSSPIIMLIVVHIGSLFVPTSPYTRCTYPRCSSLRRFHTAHFHAARLRSPKLLVCSSQYAGHLHTAHLHAARKAAPHSEWIRSDCSERHPKLCVHAFFSTPVSIDQVRAAVLLYAVVLLCCCIMYATISL